MDYYKQEYEKAHYDEKLAKILHELTSEPLLDYIRRRIEEIFPEPKESEDERIRRELIRAFTVTADKRDYEIYGNGITYGQVLAWLENQGENQYDEGTFINVDDVRDGFMSEVYRVLDADTTNDRANQIIQAFDSLPTVAIKNQDEQKSDKIIERARTEKQKVLLTETKGNAHIDWDCRSLQDAKLLLEHGLEYIDSQFEKRGEQKPVEPVTVIERDGEQWVRVCALGEDFIIAAHDYREGDKTEFTWEEACKIGTFSKKQGCIILALLNEINAKLEEIGGEPLDSSYWSSSEFDSLDAWGVAFSSGYVLYSGKCASFVARAVAAF